MNGAAIAAGSILIRPTTPTAATPPWSYANTASAIPYAQ